MQWKQFTESDQIIGQPWLKKHKTKYNNKKLAASKAYSILYINYSTKQFFIFLQVYIAWVLCANESSFTCITFRPNMTEKLFIRALNTNKKNMYNKNIIRSSFKSSRNIQKKECGPDRSISDNQSSSVTLNKLAVKAIIIYCNFEFQQRSRTRTDINLNGVQITITV